MSAAARIFHKMWHFLYHLCNFKYFSRPVNCHFWVVKRRALYKCHSLTDYSEPLITYSDELSFEPGIIFDCIKAGELATRLVDHTMVHVWVLGGRVVAPDDHILHMGGRNATAHRHLQDRSIKGKKSKFRFQDLLRQKWQQQVCESNCLKVQVWIEMKYKSESKGAHLRASSVVVQTGEAGEVLFGDGGSRLGCNQTVGVGRVSHNQHLKTHTHTKTELI